jgi:hypothetical protein
LARLPPSDKPNHFGSPPRRILEREWELYKRPEYARLATISVAQLYNLRHHHRYRERLLHYTKTRPTAVSIGERRKPQPQGQPGFLRLDTVHQGDQPEGGEKGVYHINAVDKVTQWEVAGATPRIAAAIGDSDAARRMQQAKAKLLEKMQLTGPDCWLG